jgi:hypothetical protein
VEEAPEIFFLLYDPSGKALFDHFINY